jgi:replicative DNA helicase
MNSPLADPQLADARTPPHSIEAEQSVLGGLLLDNVAWDRIADVVTAGDFYRHDHRLIYQAIGRLLEANKPADVVTVFEALQSAGRIEEAGGLAYLNALAQNTPSAANIRRYAEIVRDRAVLRRLVTVGDEIATSALAPQGRDTKSILDEAESKIFQIAEEGARGRQGFVEMDRLLTQVVERIQELFERANPSDVTGVPTGFTDLDRITAGFQKGDLVILASRPSMGKTALALNIVQHAAIEHNVGVAIFSVEMSKDQLVQRLLCSEGLVDAQRLRRGQLRDEDYPKLARAAGLLGTAPVWIDDTAALSPLAMRSKARRLKAEHDIGMVVVDYLQLMQGPSGAENRQQEISQISRSLKALAKELDVPVLALSQLSRAPEQRGGEHRRPQLSDLRESGAIEQDADVVCFIFRQEFYDGPVDPKTNESIEGLAELIVSKQRNGPTGVVKLFFKKEFTRFDNFSPREPAGGAGAAGAARGG